MKKKLLRRMDTKESRDYWEFVERIAKEVRKWPKWQREQAKYLFKYEDYN